MAEDLRDAIEGIIAHFDLGEYEVTAYLAVLEHGELTASELAEHTDIPQPRVYDTVRSLDDVGLVELTDSRPMTVLAIDPRDAFESVQESLDDLVDGLADRYTAPTRRPEAVTLVKSRPTILRYLEDIVAAAEYELMLSVTPRLLDRLADQLAERQGEGVAIEVVVSPAREAPDPDEFDYGAVATTVKGRRGITTPVVAVADGNYSLYASRESVHGNADRYGVIFNRSELGFLVSGFLNTVVWTTAETIASEGESVAFPRKYGTIRRCISDIQDLDGDFFARVEGRDVETGEQGVVEGRIVEAEFGTNREVATLTVDTGEERVAVGDRIATYEDFEAFDIAVGRETVPDL